MIQVLVLMSLPPVMMLAHLAAFLNWWRGA